ncbi:sensor domain-containing diguanylate cyclase [Thioflavicoccus mobilis]|nr:sensor domain-containing diguanylate cyclase [Thioflavicoccus mobilis]
MIATTRKIWHALADACPGLRLRNAFATTPRLILMLGIILLAGFLAVTLSSYQVSKEAVQRALVEHELPLTSDNIYSEIQASLLRPIYVSSLMAHDTFLVDWMLDGERDPQKVTRYLREIQRKYDVFSTFVVSALTRRYYHFNGILKEVSPDAQKDRWFFTMEHHPQGYRVDIDTNEASANRLTIFVNHKIQDGDGRFVGVTGLGLDVATVSQLIEHYKTRYDRDIYFVDHQGIIESHSDDRLIGKLDIHDQPGIAAVADEILAGDQGTLTYQGETGRIFIRYRYIPELSWHLIVEESEQAAIRALRHALYVDLGIGGGITLLVLAISGFTVHRFQSRLERLASIDPLSGLFNRQFFEALFANALSTARRLDHELSLLLFDIDLFKQINDTHGHPAGDRVIEQIARIVESGRRETDIAARWGGDEFVVLLVDCDESDARRIAEGLRHRVEQEVRVPDTDRPVTISTGVAAYRRGENLKDLTARIDTRLYAAKAAGRNRVA